MNCKRVKNADRNIRRQKKKLVEIQNMNANNNVLNMFLFVTFNNKQQKQQQQKTMLYSIVCNLILI